MTEQSSCFYPEWPESSSGDPGSPPPDMVRFTTQWHLSLDVLIDELERLPSMTELRFLKVGAMLQSLSARLEEIGRGADEAAYIMSGEETMSVTLDLERLLDLMEVDFQAADRIAGHTGNSLTGILVELGAMGRLMESFKGHVGNLRMLKLLTNIQGASLADRGAGFRKVAEDIGNLARSITVKSTAIIARVRTLHGDLVKAETMVAGLGVTQQQLNRTMVTAIKKKIAALGGMHQKCSVAARDVSGRSGEISRNIGAIVVSLQFQDITRQQMEHAREQLVGVRRRIGAAGPLTASGSLSRQLANICALQSAQLAHSVDELTTAVTRVRTSLKEVSREALESATQVHDLFLQTGEVEQMSLADIEQGLETVMGAFAEKVAVSESLSAIMLSVTTAMGEITGFAADIDYLGSDIRLIALNAIVKAAQAGKEGASFTVIAENVTQQSDAICRQAATITAAIGNITGHVAELGREVTLTGDDQGAPGSLHGDELAATMSRLRELTGAASELLARTEQAAVSMDLAIDEALAALESREIIALVQQDVIPRLNRLAKGAHLHQGGETDGMVQTGLESSALRYTMGSERKVHQLFAATLIEGGGGDAAYPRPAVPGELAGDFGENVEFF